MEYLADVFVLGLISEHLTEYCMNGSFRKFDHRIRIEKWGALYAKTKFIFLNSFQTCLICVMTSVNSRG